MDSQDELLDIRQAASFLNVSQTSLRRWTRSGRLACLRLGLKRERRFRRSDLIAFMENQPGLLGQAENGPSSNTAVGGVSIPHGCHLCSIYTTPAGRARQAVAFLADGLAEGTTCFLVGAPAYRNEILNRLQKGYSSLSARIDAGSLVMAEYADTPSHQIEQWESMFLAALSRGATSMRVVGDVTGGPLDGDDPRTVLLEYEDGYDRLLAQRFPVVTLCQYSTEMLLKVGLRDVFCRHPDIFAYPVDRLMD